MRSPCVSVCRIDEASGLCAGCWRTIDEIAAWGQASDAEKRRIWARLRERRRLAAQRDDGEGTAR